MASATFPLLTAVTGIMHVLTGATKITSRTPVLDATIAMIPGLAAQARTGDNPSIASLHRGIDPSNAPEYFAIKSDFTPPPIGSRWWRVFQNPGDRIKNFGADLVFNEPNDLVVNAASMDDLADRLSIPNSTHVYDYGQTNAVHHTNYFKQAKTVERFAHWLQLP